MIRNPILYFVSWYALELLQNFHLNYLYVDALAREQVLQQKIYPNRAYDITSNYKIWYLPCSQFDTVQSLKKVHKNPLFSSYNYTSVYNDDLCNITGINYYNFVEQYQKHICVIDLDDFYKK